MPVIPDEVRRRLERQYHPTQRLETIQTHSNTTHGRDQALSTSSTIGSPHFEMPQRVLPKSPATDDNLDASFVAFILYCNPTIPLDTDSTELKKIFRAPPKSDGKSFSTYVLYELIRKLELKEIKTWAQLAIDLGVEPPALEKGQSAQKVQQYAVRLKRWMHAMHVDAFFEYLLGKPHVYWTQVPSVNELVSDQGRDGVPPEEDLALRALLPETRPKRGRRKNEDRDASDSVKSPSQRPRLGSPTLSDDFMVARAPAITENPTPSTATNTFSHSFNARIMPWPMEDEMRGQLGAFRWPPGDSTPTALSAYPQSAITPTNRSQMWHDPVEPRSAITPKTRSRRRHGPAVSSAWPSNGGTASGKLRGRPPSNRSVTDGPFSTFPANPGSKIPPGISHQDTTPVVSAVAAESEASNFYQPGETPNTLDLPSSSGRPARLQLQVPPREGGTVRLATPPFVPPVLLVNGEETLKVQQNPMAANPQQFTPLMEYFNPPAYQNPGLQHFVSFTFRQNEDADRTNVDALESHFICEILAAEWFDVSGQSIERCSIDEADTICKQVVENLKAESSSTEAFLINLSALAGGPLMTRLRMTRLEEGSISHYECHWKMRFGSIQGEFMIRATVDHGCTTAELEHGPVEPEESWKKRYLDLQQQIRERDEKVGNLRRGVLDALVVSSQLSSELSNL